MSSDSVFCVFWPRGWGLSMSNYPTLFQPIELILTPSIRLFESSCFHGEALTVALALAVASLQRALHGTKKKVEFSITFSDPHQKCLREPWKFLFFFLFPACGPSIEKLLTDPLLSNPTFSSVPKDRSAAAILMLILLVNAYDGINSITHPLAPRRFSNLDRSTAKRVPRGCQDQTIHTSSESSRRDAPYADLFGTGTMYYAN